MGRLSGLTKSESDQLKKLKHGQLAIVLVSAVEDMTICHGFGARSDFQGTTYTYFGLTQTDRNKPVTEVNKEQEVVLLTKHVQLDSESHARHNYNIYSLRKEDIFKIPVYEMAKLSVTELKNEKEYRDKRVESFVRNHMGDFTHDQITSINIFIGQNSLIQDIVMKDKKPYQAYQICKELGLPITPSLESGMKDYAYGAVIALYQDMTPTKEKVEKLLKSLNGLEGTGFLPKEIEVRIGVKIDVPRFLNGLNQMATKKPENTVTEKRRLVA
ncbi:MAG: hypothetical protein KGH94_00210 [Candidatus Micrarchaeota archaeon]|nr:hypothetical protein [Candidatus Micrarchaeota archaeon]